MISRRCGSARDFGLRLVDRAPALKRWFAAEAAGAGRARAAAAAGARRCERGEGLEPRTLAAQALGRIDEATRGVVPPLHVTTTFMRDPDNGYSSGNIYGRPDNADGARGAKRSIGALEGAAATLLFGSGMSAAIALFLSFAPGAHIVAPQVMYWALRNWLPMRRRLLGLEVTFCDAEDLAALRAAMRPGATKLVWLETPSNPLWGVSDIAGAARVAHEAGAVARRRLRPARRRCSRGRLALGADVVMHSATKYLNGHSDVDRRRARLRARGRAQRRACEKFAQATA